MVIFAGLWVPDRPGNDFISTSSEEKLVLNVLGDSLLLVDDANSTLMSEMKNLNEIIILIILFTS